jgi:hypothetical protein
MLPGCAQTKPHPTRRCNSFPRQGPASQRESSPALCEVTTTAKREQSDGQATTKVKRLSPVTILCRGRPSPGYGKAPVGVGFGDYAGDSAGVSERGMSGNGRMEELGKPMGFSGDE